MSSIVLRASLADVGLESVLQLAETEGFTCMVSVSEERWVAVREGRMAGARSGPYEGLTALVELLSLRDGEVSILLGEPESDQPGVPMDHAVMGALRLYDEWVRLAPMVLAPQPDTPGDERLDPVLRWMDGERTVAEAVMLGGRVAGDIVEPLLEAMRGGWLRPVAPDAPERAEAAVRPPDPEDYFSLIDEGRQALRARDFGQAELAFRRALLARPGDSMARQNLRRVLQLRSRER
ncbi:MAG: DUF4388 domain-containing protein [Alphaproteobacteria bacterium]|nr:DUF4388 domain-containing protein [Alphaproteobacteria bacterium]